MDTVELHKDIVSIPAEFLGYTHLTVRTPWHTTIIRGRSETTYCRSKELGEKPYVPEGTIEFKLPGKAAKRFKVVPRKKK